MRKLLRLALVTGLITSSLIIQTPARASFHVMQITEVFTGVGGAPNAQYVELTTLDDGQHEVGETEVRLYDATGTRVATAAFSGDVPDAQPPQSKILVGTAEAEAFFGVTMDATFTADPSIDTGGKACFLLPRSDYPTYVVDCVAWGSYTGRSAGVGGETGYPISENEGIPAGAAIERRMDRGSPSIYDELDDINISRRDFRLASPVPDGGGTPSVTLQRIGFTFSSLSGDEDQGSVDVPISRDGGTSGAKEVTFLKIDGSATGNQDYTPAVDEQVQFAHDDGAETKSIVIADDAIFEGPETVELRVRNPTDGAVLGDNMTATFTIHDLEDDGDPPTTRITRPDHDWTYWRSKLTSLKGSADDGPGQAAAVEVSIRRTMKNGSCKWWRGDHWQKDPCGPKQWATTAKLSEDHGFWVYELPIVLPRSVGTRTSYYTAFSRAEDQAGNVESAFEVGRNAIRFGIR